MKYLVFGDVEVHPYRRFNEGDRRLINCLEVIKGAFDKAVENECDFILFTGDIIEQANRIDFRVIRYLYEVLEHCFSETDLNVYAISGNHDQPDSYGEDKYSFIDLITSMFQGRFNCIDNDLFEFDGWRIGGIPYIDERFPEKFAEAFQALRGCDIVLIHQTPTGLDVPFNTIDVPKTDSLKLCGHIHKPQSLRDDLMVIGGGLSKNFGDTGDRYYWIIDGVEVVDLIETGMPKFGRTPKFEYYEPELTAPEQVEVDESQVFDIVEGKKNLVAKWCDSNDLGDGVKNAGINCLI